MPAPKVEMVRVKTFRTKGRGDERYPKRLVDYKGRTVTQDQSTIAVLEGEEDVRTWTDEELVAGGKGYRTGGAGGALIPRQCHDELVRRTLERANGVLLDALVGACEELAAIAKGEKESLGDQIRAINMVMERVMGKPKDSVEVTVHRRPWEEALVTAIVGDDEDIVDAEVVELEGDG